MRKRVIAGGLMTATVITLSVMSVLPASAEPTPAPTIEPGRTPLEQFRIDRENYNAAMRERALSIKNINVAFKAACDKANVDFKSAMAVARTPDQKNLAAQARKSAVSAAVIARDSAIAALGAEPVPPVEPPKPMKAPKAKVR